MATAASPKIRFYKFVTAPKDSGATITVGGKQIAGASFAPTLSAINSLGATVNSIGVMLTKQQNAARQQIQDQRKRQQLAKDKALENRIEGGAGANLGEKIGSVLSVAAPSFLEWLGKFLKSMLFVAALDWLADPKNKRAIQTTLERLGSFFNATVKFFKGITGFINGAWEQTFGKDKTWQERLKGALKLVGVGAAALVGLSFLKNPVGTIANFGRLLGMVGGGILNLGKFLGSNVIGQTVVAAAQGYAAYQRTLQDESIPEEDRQSAAIGAGVGATVGGVALAQVGNAVAGPLGGLIGNALGAFLGEHAGKFLGPIIKNVIEPLSEFFGQIMEAINAFLEPIKNATREFFEQLGPAIQKMVDFIAPHMPVIKEVASFLGEVAFAPLIWMLKGLTQVLKWVNGSSDMSEDLSNAGGAALDTVTGATPARAGEMPASSNLGSFIGAVESGNDYTKLVGGKKDSSILTKTITQLLNERGGQFAMGRYQIQMRTASEVLRNAGKDPAKFKFDQNGQDYIYDLLLKRRGLNDFMSGKISTERFAKNLSMEWAALPRGADNLSYYHGDGRNKAHRKWQDTIAVLEKMKGGRSKGGWIRGPQSGYPVSLTGKGVDFIGHGTEYVAQRSSGGFVIPFDTPHTRRDPGLTARRMSQAASLGYLKSEGGKLPEMGLGGFLKGIAKGVGRGIDGIMGTVKPVMQTLAPAASAIPGVGQAVGTGAMIMDLFEKVQDVTDLAEAQALSKQVQTIVLDVIEMPGVGGGGDGDETPIVLPGKQNPANQFLQSRFGFLNEGTTVLSNFF